MASHLVLGATSGPYPSVIQPHGPRHKVFPCPEPSWSGCCLGKTRKTCGL